VCDCIATTEKLIREKTGDPNAWVQTSVSILEKGQEYPSGLMAFYREKRADGRFKLKESRIGIKPTFCPFCGVKYDKGPS